VRQGSSVHRWGIRVLKPVKGMVVVKKVVALCGRWEVKWRHGTDTHKNEGL